MNREWLIPPSIQPCSFFYLPFLYVFDILQIRLIKLINEIVWHERGRGLATWHCLSERCRMLCCLNMKCSCPGERKHNLVCKTTIWQRPRFTQRCLPLAPIRNLNYDHLDGDLTFLSSRAVLDTFHNECTSSLRSVYFFGISEWSWARCEFSPTVSAQFWAVLFTCWQNIYLTGLTDHSGRELINVKRSGSGK